MGVPGILLVCLSVLLPGSCWLMHQVQGQVTVTVLDVGQGDGICIRIFVTDDINGVVAQSVFLLSVAYVSF